MKSLLRLLCSFSLIGLLAGCGTFVPEIQETADPDDGQRLVQSIVINITCEVQDAVYDVYQDNKNGTFLDDWGVQMTLSLTNEEKASASPNVSWLPPGIVTIAAGVSGSADATRVDKINSYNLVQDLKNARCPAKERPGGFFMMQSDLKLKQWLYDAVAASQTQLIKFGKDTVDGPFKENVVYHEVKFDVITSGTVTPVIKLARVTVDPTGSLLTASRERTHDLIVTIGPADKSYKTLLVRGKPKRVLVASPSYEAESLHNSGLLGNAVSDGIGSKLNR